MNRLVSQTDDRGKVTSHLYDALNRRIRETFHDGTFTEVQQYDKDDNVKVLGVTKIHRV